MVDTAMGHARSVRMEVKCLLARTRAIPLDAIRRPRDIAIWKLEGFLEVQVVSTGPKRAARAHDRADRGAGDCAVLMGASLSKSDKLEPR